MLTVLFFQNKGQRAKSLKKNIKDRAKTAIAVQTTIRRSEVAPEDLRILTNFNNTADHYLTPCSKDLKVTSMRYAAFFKTMEKPCLKGIVSSNNFVPGGDKFINSFVSTYQTNKDVRSHLLVGLMEAFIAKLNGVRAPVYGAAVTNFFLSLNGCGSKIAVEFASANLGKCISMRYLQKLASDKRPPPFIQHSRDDLTSIVTSHINRIRIKFGDDR